MIPGPAPFIVGIGRSGTTLLRLMLDAHPALAIPNETLFLQDLLRPGQRCASKDAFLRAVTAAETWDNLALDKTDLSEALDALNGFSLPDAVRCFYRLYARRHGKARWGDKTPYYRVCMTAIQNLLPEAHFIHVIRDGRDSALSYRGLWFGPGDDFAAQAKFWSQGIVDARAQAERLPHYLEVRYEDLVRDPEITLRRICDDIALPFSPAMSDYHAGAAARLAEITRPHGPRGRTPRDLQQFTAIYERTKSPPDPSRIGRWRTEMADDDQRRYEAVAGAMLRELGYETRFS